MPDPTPARHLRVRVSRDGAVRAELTFPAAAVEGLATLMPPDLLETLRRRDIDVDRIAADAVAGGLAPGELFQSSDGGKDVRVWLE